MYELAIFVHILAGIAWFGTGLTFQLHMSRMRSVSGGRMMARIEVAGSEGGDVGPLVDRHLSVAWIDVAILTVLLALMVFKPGV